MPILTRHKPYFTGKTGLPKHVRAMAQVLASARSALSLNAVNERFKREYGAPSGLRIKSAMTVTGFESVSELLIASFSIAIYIRNH